jgi:predicted permease
MLFYAFYIVAAIILILHFTGWLKRNNLEWLVLVLAVATFPAVIFL